MAKIIKNTLSWFNKYSFQLSIISASLSVIIYLVHFINYRYAFPLLKPDEASFLSPAYDLVHKGKFSTSIHGSFLPGANQYTYWMPPFFMVVLAGYLKVVGFSFAKAKFFSFICYIASAVTLSFISRNTATKLWTLSLVLGCPFVIMASSTIRMESIGFLVTCLTILAVKEGANVVVLALLAGATVLIHPIFLACGTAIGLVILSRKNWTQLALFIAIVLLTISPYLRYITQNPPLFWEQMQLQLNRKTANSLFSIDFAYLIQFAPLSVISFYLLYRIKNPGELIIFLTVGLLLINLLILKSQEFNYHLNVIPYTVAILALYIDEQMSKYSVGITTVIVINLFFLLLLYQKLKKNDFMNDTVVYEMADALNASSSQWNNREIYVSDNTPDLTPFLLLSHQRVERINAIVKFSDPRWYEKYDCVIDLKDNELPEDKSPRFWVNWQRVSFYKTKNNHFSISVYRKI